jgi:hypothetical protein
VNGEEIHPPVIISPCSVAMRSQRTAFSQLFEVQTSASGLPVSLCQLCRSSDEGKYSDTLAHHFGEREPML